jgi:hypothetical protein
MGKAMMAQAIVTSADMMTVRRMIWRLASSSSCA